MANNICRACQDKIKKTNNIIVVKDDITAKVYYIHDKCCIYYLEILESAKPMELQNKIFPSEEQTRYIDDYAESNQAITETEFLSLKNEYKKVRLQAHPDIVKIKTRNKIWESVGSKYIQNLRLLRILNEKFTKNPDQFENGFEKKFIPSVIEQFKQKGYLSNMQWDWVKKYVFRSIDSYEYMIIIKPVRTAIELKELSLTERLRYEQRKQSFMKWYNEKHNIVEND